MGGDMVIRRRRRLVRLHLDGKPFSLEGLLVGVDRGHYRLANVVHIESQDRSHPLPGEAWVPRAHVLYVQVIG